jgi:hypothetical protein
MHIVKVDTDPKIHNKYYLGKMQYQNNDFYAILHYSITLPYFFSKNIRKQFYYILQLYIENDVYYVINKTYWLRIIQRKWKKYMKERIQKIHLLSNINTHLFFSLRGRYIRKFSDITTS